MNAQIVCVINPYEREGGGLMVCSYSKRPGVHVQPVENVFQQCSVRKCRSPQRCARGHGVFELMM